MAIIQSRNSGRYAATNTTRSAWTSNLNEAFHFVDVAAAERFIYDVLAESIGSLYPTNRGNVLILEEGKLVRADATQIAPDGPEGYGW